MDSYWSPLTFPTTVETASSTFDDVLRSCLRIGSIMECYRCSLWRNGFVFATFVGQCLDRWTILKRTWYLFVTFISFDQSLSVPTYLFCRYRKTGRFLLFETFIDTVIVSFSGISQYLTLATEHRLRCRAYIATTERTAYSWIPRTDSAGIPAPDSIDLTPHLSQYLRLDLLGGRGLPQASQTLCCFMLRSFFW